MRTCLERSLCAGLPQFPFSVLSLSLVYTRAAASLRLPAPPQPPLKGKSDVPGVSQLPPTPTVSRKLLKMRLPPGQRGWSGGGPPACWSIPGGRRLLPAFSEDVWLIIMEIRPQPRAPWRGSRDARTAAV